VRFPPGSDISIPIVLTAWPSQEPREGFLSLLHGDDIGASNGEPLRIAFLEGNGEGDCYITSSSS
jgi:hypothetical protein